MAVELLGEDPLADGLGFFLARTIESISEVRRLVDLDDERAHRRLVTVVMSVEEAFVGRPERLRERREGAGRAEPGEAVGEQGDPRAESLLVAADDRADAVGPDHEIGLGELAGGRHRVAVARLHADRARDPLEDAE
jgi:hypothetical protein